MDAMDYPTNAMEQLTDAMDVGAHYYHTPPVAGAAAVEHQLSGECFCR